MEADPTRVCELIVGLGDVEVIGVDDGEGAPLRVHIRRRAPRPGCGGCGGPLWSKGGRQVVLAFPPGVRQAEPAGAAQAPLALSADAKLRGLLEAGDPYGEVRDAWHSKETLRAVYEIPDAKLGAATVAQLASDLQDPGLPVEVNRLGRTLWRWRAPISNWYAARVTNAATEAANNLIKRVKRAAFGFTNFANYRIRALLYAGKPDWTLLDTLTPP